MTILEAQYLYGVKECSVSEGDSITSLVFRLYKSYSDIYYRVLLTLNIRYDWYNLTPGTLVRYLDSSVVSQINEIL